jgi:outer membrane protein OmpA-like peptidoglycan-associated protein
MKKALLATIYSLLFIANANAIDFGKVSEITKKASAELEQIAEKLEKLQSDKIKVSEEERGVVLTFSAQLFAVGKADLTDEAEENLQEAAKTLAEYPDANVEIEGHTDSTGSAKLNQDLSEKRAKNVMNFLIKQGIAKERLSAVGYGKDRPIADNGTEEGRAANRRVELIVKKKEEAQEKIEKEGIRFGIRAGLAAVGVKGEIPPVANEPRYGVGLGGFALIPISSIYFAPELFIHYRKPGVFSNSDLDAYITLSEVGIDIPLVFRIPLGKDRKFYLEAGPQIGFVIIPAWTLEYGGREEYNDVGDRIFEYGLTLGAGYRITDNWSVDLRGYYSLANYGTLVEGPLDGPLYYAQIGVSYLF